MLKKGNKIENKKQNDSKIIEFIQPIIEIIIKDIIQSRIKDINDKESLIINYKTNNNKIIDLSQIEIKTDSKIPHIYEINIYVTFKRNDILFIVEHWKFKIDTSDFKSNELDSISKKRIKKKLITFYRSIKSLELILPLNSLVKKSFDYTFQVKLYHQSNIEIITQEKIKKEKKHIKLETKDINNLSIQLDIYFYTINGITTFEQSIKEIIDYNKIYTDVYSKVSLSKTGKSKITSNLIENETKTNPNSMNFSENNDNTSEDFTEESNKDELFFSSLIVPKIIDKKGDVKDSDVKDIKKDIINAKVNLEELFGSCFNKIDDINCRKNIDELLNRNNLMKEEDLILNGIQENCNLYFDNNKLLADELYEETKNFNFKDLMIYNSNNNINETNFKLNNEYMDNLQKDNNKKNDKENENEKVLIRDVINDFFEIKQLLNH